MNKEKIIELINKPETQSYLKEHRIKHLRLVGSMAKDMQHADSDVDFVYEVNINKPRKGWGIVSVKNFLENLIQKKVDIMEQSRIKENIRNEVLLSKIQVF